MSDRQIANSCSMARNTVAEYIKRATRAGLIWPLANELDDGQLEDRLFSKTAPIVGQSRPLPDFKTIRNELLSHKSVTLPPGP
jgi:hypothetical protein